MSAAPAPCRFTVEQLTRLHAIVDAWNAVRRDDRRRAVATEVIDFMLTQEEESIAAMCANAAAETRAELAREDLADEKLLPPQAGPFTRPSAPADPLPIFYGTINH